MMHEIYFVKSDTLWCIGCTCISGTLVYDQLCSSLFISTFF